MLVVYALGGLDWLELKTLDQRFIHANSVPESHQIVCIDIDDASLGMVGRWPWPRDVQAALIRILTEAGVKALLVDITLTDAEPLRTITPRQADVSRDLLRIGMEGAVLALPDQELASAIAAHGAVYLATDYAAGENWKDYLESDEFSEVLTAVQRGDTAEAERRAGDVKGRSAARRTWTPLVWAHLIAALEADPTQDARDLGQRLNLSGHDTEAAERALETCRAAALNRRIRAWLDAAPERWQQPAFALYELVRTEVTQDLPRLDEPLAVALRHVLGARATRRTAFAPLDAVRAVARPVDAVSPVYYLHARAARRCGFVVFEPDWDGVMRRMRLLVQHEGQVLPQLALAVACDALGVGPNDITAAPGRLELRIPGQDQPLVVQLDEQGRTLVPWVSQRDWSRQFGAHVPMGAVFEIFDRRQSVMSNRGEVLALLAALPVRAGGPDTRPYAEDLAQRLRLESALHAARYGGDAASVHQHEEWIAEYERVLAEDEGRLRPVLAAELERLTAPPGWRDDAERVREAAVHESLQRAFAAVDAYQGEIAATLDRLRKRVEGRIGLIGYTATALADMTPIPTHKRAPGVIAHADLLNGLLGGRMVRWAPPWLNVLPAALLGVLATVFSARWGPRTAAIVGLLITAYLIFAGYIVFYVFTYWIALTPAVAALAASYISVLAHRYLFLERERRQLALSLSQYTSATLARKMAEDPELCKRAEMREVTAVFTDLAGFTPISERIGAERTQRVLNVSLGAFSDVILHHEGMLNKFIGDGVFAFWNPVIYPQADHARRACETAIDLQVALQELIAQQQQAAGDEAFGELVLRIGVATGSAVVGPCGSDKKYDYTCIGDSVNVAARLESANKFFGTRILISAATRAQAGDSFAVRPLGGVIVKGKTTAVPIYELLGRTDAVDAELLQYSELFGQVVEAFQQRDWRRALRILEECERRRPGDLATARYAQMAQRYLAAPPGDEWEGVLTLTEK